MLVSLKLTAVCSSVKIQIQRGCRDTSSGGWRLSAPERGFEDSFAMSDVKAFAKKQVEFYFCDANLPRDKFLIAEANKDEDKPGEGQGCADTCCRPRCGSRVADDSPPSGVCRGRTIAAMQLRPHEAEKG